MADWQTTKDDGLPHGRASRPGASCRSDLRQTASLLLICIRDAHAEGQWQSTINGRQNVTLPPATSIQERKGHARMCVRRLDGRVRYQSGLSELDFDAAAWERAIRAATGGSR